MAKLFTAFGEILLKKRGVDEGIDQTKRKAQELGDGFQKMGREADVAGQKTEGLTKKFSVFQEVLSKVLIPVLIARQVTQVIGELDKLRAKVDELDKGFRDTSLSFQRGLLGDGGLSEEEKQIRAVLEQARATKQAIADRAEQEAALLREASAWGKLKNAIAGVTEEAIRQRAEAQISATDQAARREEDRIKRQAELAQELENQAALERANRAREELLEKGRLFRQQQEEERRQQEIAFGDQVAQAEQNHRDELDRMQERHLKQIELDRKAHEARLRQIDREAAAATRASEQIGLRLGVAGGNASGLLQQMQEINSKTQRPTMRIRTTRGGG